MQLQRSINYSNENEPTQLTMERIEKKQYSIPSNSNKEISTGKQATQVEQQANQNNTIKGTLPLNSLADQSKKQNHQLEQGYTEGLKNQLQNQRASGQKDIIEMAKVEGTEEAVKTAVAEIERNKTKLNDLVNNIQNILFSCKTVFPFDLFPNEITIDSLKIVIKNHEFIRSSQLRIIPIKEIIDAIAETSPFFSTLKILHRKDPYPIVIKPIFRSNAIKACSIIQGLLIVERQQIDISRLPVEQSANKLEAIGHTQMEI